MSTQEAPSPLTRELLAWISAEPRTYRHVIEVWQTSCPRHPVWEDAVGDGYVEVVRGRDVRLTAAGREALEHAS